MFRQALKFMALAALLAICSRSTQAVEFDGSARIWLSSSDGSVSQTDLLDQRYTLNLFQELTPYLRARLGYMYQGLDATLEPGEDYVRTSNRPMLELNYARERLTSRLAFYGNSVSGTRAQDQFDIRSYLANLSWRPRFGPVVTINYSQDQNVADVAVFGRDVTSDRLSLDLSHYGRFWGVGYLFENLNVANELTELHTDQMRHELRGNASKYLFSGKLLLGASGTFSHLERSTELGNDTDPAEPIPAIEGLSAIDLTPEIGDLRPAPLLIDGDINTPASPELDIGGANTFRNVGVDLGVTRPVSRLEIYVNTVSGAGVQWQVYRSRDNLFWEPVPGALTEFDPALLLYRLRFPETEDRFFKALNTSINSVPRVFVTEIRALRDFDPTGSEIDIEGNLYRADVSIGLRPVQRVRGNLSAGASTDRDLADGVVRRDFEEIHARAGLSVDLRRNLIWDVGYRYDDSEEIRDPVLFRTVQTLSTNLRWFPLPTVDLIVAAQQREEFDREDLIQTITSSRFDAVTDLLPDLRLISGVEVARVEDPFAGRDRNSFVWRERLEMSPTMRWRVAGGFTHTQTETVSGESLLDRTQYLVSTTWQATRALVLTSNWYITDDNGRTTVDQGYSVAYNPGPKFTITGTYRGLTSHDDRGLTTDGINATYRLTRRFTLFGNLTRSSTEVANGLDTSITSLRFGLNLFF